MTNYKVNGWMHPKNGTPKTPFTLDLVAGNDNTVAKLASYWLKCRSTITNDFTVTVC